MDRNKLEVIADGAFRGLHNVTYLYVLSFVVDVVKTKLHDFNLLRICCTINFDTSCTAYLNVQRGKKLVVGLLVSHFVQVSL